MSSDRFECEKCKLPNRDELFCSRKSVDDKFKWYCKPCYENRYGRWEDVLLTSSMELKDESKISQGS